MADRTPDEIEREIENERAALSQSLEALQRELAPNVLIDKATARLREHGGTVAETALRQARENPVAMAVTGLGLAWLAAGPAMGRQSRPLRLPPPKPGVSSQSLPQRDTGMEHHLESPAPGQPTARRIPAPPRPSPAYDHRTYERVSGFRETSDPMAGFDDRLARANGDSTDPTVKERLGVAMASAKEKLMSLKTRMADSGHDSGKNERSLRDYLTEGTDKMSRSTRDRVIAARQAAWDAEKRLESYARDYADAGREFYGSQPLIGGLLAFGIGAAIGAALPRTRQENRYLGSYRDRAIDEAERFYRSEAEKLRAVAENAVEDARKMANDTLDAAASEAKEATSTAGDKAKSAAGNVANDAQKNDSRTSAGQMNDTHKSAGQTNESHTTPGRVNDISKSPGLAGGTQKPAGQLNDAQKTESQKNDGQKPENNAFKTI